MFLILSLLSWQMLAFHVMAFHANLLSMLSIKEIYLQCILSKPIPTFVCYRNFKVGMNYVQFIIQNFHASICLYDSSCIITSNLATYSWRHSKRFLMQREKQQQKKKERKKKVSYSTSQEGKRELLDPNKLNTHLAISIISSLCIKQHENKPTSNAVRNIAGIGTAASFVVAPMNKRILHHSGRHEMVLIFIALSHTQQMVIASWKKQDQWQSKGEHRAHWDFHDRPFLLRASSASFLFSNSHKMCTSSYSHVLTSLWSLMSPERFSKPMLVV